MEQGLLQLWSATGLANFELGQLLMIAVGLLLLFLAIAKGFEPLLLLPIGFGAVLLTRAGRRREYYPYDADAAWEEAMQVDVDDDNGGAESAPNG